MDFIAKFQNLTLLQSQLVWKLCSSFLKCATRFQLLYILYLNDIFSSISSQMVDIIMFRIFQGMICIFCHKLFDSTSILLIYSYRKEIIDFTPWCQFWEDLEYDSKSQSKKKFLKVKTKNVYSWFIKKMSNFIRNSALNFLNTLKYWPFRREIFHFLFHFLKYARLRALCSQSAPRHGM